MLTFGGDFVKKRMLILLLTSLLLVGTNLRPVYRVSVDGTCLEGLYEPETLCTGLSAAHAAAEEITTGEVHFPVWNTRRLLRLRRGDGKAETLVEALLCGCGEVEAGDGVWINGSSLGVVANGELLLEKIYTEIVQKRPEGAAVGNISGLLRILPVYTRPERLSSEEEMLCRVLSAAPVFYVDWHGRLVAG